MIPNISVNGSIQSLQVGDNNTITSNVVQSQHGGHNVMVSTKNDELLQQLFSHVDSMSGEDDMKEQVKEVLRGKLHSHSFPDIAKRILSQISNINNVVQFYQLLENLF